MDIKNSGIYKITCICNGKFYIGSAIIVKKRWSEHLGKLRKNKHDNEYLQNSFNKYGEKNFLFEMIEEVLNINNLLIREQYWLDKLNSYDRNIGFNISKTAGSQLGYRHTQKTKEKISKALIGRNVLNKSRDKARLSNPALKTVICLETGEEFKGINYTAKKFNLNRNSVKDNCNHVQNSAGGFHFLFREDYLSLKYSQILDIVNERFTFLQIKQMEKEGIIFNDNIVSREFLFYKVYQNNNGKHDYKYMCKRLIDLNNFFKRLNNWNGYYVKKEIVRVDYHEQDFNIQKNNKQKYFTRKVICKNDNKIFISVSEAGRYYNIKISNIYSVCSGRTKQTKGYVFKYYED